MKHKTNSSPASNGALHHGAVFQTCCRAGFKSAPRSNLRGAAGWKPAIPRTRLSALRRLSSAAVVALAALALPVHAHPGHGFHDADALHLLTSPDHLAVLALSGVAFLVVGRFIQRCWPRRWVQGLGAAALFAAALLWQVRG